MEEADMKREAVIVGEGTEYPLNGMLTLPDDLSAPVPAVVMVHGSGPSNMDEKVRKLTPFKDLADGLAKRGIASIRYDKRTFAHRFEMMKIRDLTVREETIDDALLALDILRKDPRIDSGALFILGHSMGAMLAPRIDAEGGSVRGLVMMAGTPHRLEDIVIRQIGRAGGDKPVMKWAMGKMADSYEKKFEGLYGLSDEEAKKKKFSGGLSLWYFKEMGRKTASDYLLENDKPVLIMQGGMDVQVEAADDFEEFKEQLADRKNTEYRLYPYLDHAFVTALSDDFTRASREFALERHIGPEVFDDIADFIKRWA